MIDIIIPCYNAEKYIKNTIESVIGQTEKHFKIICIDDCSTDKTYSILQQLAQQHERIMLLKNEKNCGIAATRNRGIKECTSEYIAFLDDDDIMPPQRLQICREYLDKNPNVGVVAGNYLTFDENGNKKIVQKEKFYSASEVRSELPFINIIPNGSTLIRRSIIEENNIFFSEALGIEDYTLYAEISKVSDINVLPDIFLEHRVMATQYSSVCVNSEEKFIKRQEKFDRVHRLLMENITDICTEKDMKIYLRFMQENIKNIKLTEVINLSFAFSHMKQAVKRKGNADYNSFCKACNGAIKRAIKAYVADKVFK